MTPLVGHKTFLDFFPAPEFLLLSTAGIAITDVDTKFVQLKRDLFGNKFKLAHSNKASNPAGAVEAGLISNSAELIPVLKKLYAIYGVRYTYATLPEEKSYLFTTTIDQVPPEGLKDAVAFIIEENVPVSLAESVFDFEVVTVDRETKLIKVAVSVLPKSVVNSYIELFEAAGIIPISFDLESQAIAKAVIHRGDKRAHLIVNLSIRKTGFYVVEEEVVQFSTTPAYGVGVGDLQSDLEDLKAEMHKVFSFWNTRTDKLSKLENKIEKVTLCGLGANNQDFVERLMSGVEVKYEFANVWLNTSSSRSRIPEISFNESLDYASAIGLVLSRYKEKYV